MKHVTAFLIKYLTAAVILEILLGLLTALTFVQILMISLWVTIACYLIGDLLVLTFSSNTVAALVNALIAFGVIYAFSYGIAAATAAYVYCAISAAVFGIGDWFFHRYMARKVFPRGKKT